jgi:hypothetical protein
VEPIHKVRDGLPHTGTLIAAGEVSLVIATTRIGDAAAVRDSAPCGARRSKRASRTSPRSPARAAAAAIRALRAGEVQPIALQDLHPV